VIGPQLRQRSDAELLTRYFEVHFDDVAAELAASGPEAPGPEPGSVVRQRQLAAAQLRQFVRGLMRTRGTIADRAAVIEVVMGMEELTNFQRDMLRARVSAVLDRAEGKPNVLRGAQARVAKPALLATSAQLQATATSAPPAGPSTEADITTPDAGEAAAFEAEAALLERAGEEVDVSAEAEVYRPRPAEDEAIADDELAFARAALAPSAVKGSATSSAISSVLGALVVKALEQVGADLCQVFILDDEINLTLRAEAPSEGGPVTGPRLLSTTDGFAARIAAAEGPLVLESPHLLGAGEQTWLERGMTSLAGVAVGAEGELGSGILVAGRASGRRFGDDELEALAALAAEVTLAMASADLVARAEELAVLKERMKLARDIHDGLASDLSAVVALFKYHEHRREVDPSDAEGLLLQMRELVEQSLQNARDILATLRPRHKVPAHLADAVRRHVEDFSQTYGITAITRILGEDDDIDEEERDTLYQVLREALTNVRKHSEAGVINITLDLRQPPYSLVVEDDGIGIDIVALEEKAGSFGLLGMRERAELIGGSVEITASAMGGARISFYGPPVPLARP
jgi:signal transduction histidine kinase